MSGFIVALLLLNIAEMKSEADFNQGGLINVLENKFEHKLSEYAENIGKWVENIKDLYFNKSELGRLFGYTEMKNRYQTIESGRGMKKMSMAMLPVIFQVGAASTWMILTALLAAKSVAIGVILLVFKIAVSSAKLASFFTAWKSKHPHHDYSWSPQYEHHSLGRSFRDAGAYSNTFQPNLLETNEYKSIQNSFSAAGPQEEHTSGS